MKTITSTILSILFVFITAVDVEAGNLDKYIDMFQNGHYTLKYVDVTPIPLNHNKDVTNIYYVNLYGSNFINIYEATPLHNNQTEHCVVVNGQNKYSEISYGTFATCKLVLGQDVFNFSKITDDKGKTTYYGNKSGHVIAVKRNIVMEIMSGVDCGGEKINRFFTGVMPAANRSNAVIAYKKVGSGNLGNGLDYEDYLWEGQGVKEIVRYYFQNSNLAKISAMMYWRDENGKWATDKTIIKIKEFTAAPQQEYLSLPIGLKDDTKRKNK